MKTLVLISALMFLVACGKDSKESSRDFSLSALQNQGVYFQSYGQSLVIYCSSNGSTTNQTRLNTLQNFMNSIGVDNSKTLYYEMNGMQIEPYRMKSLLQQAISSLQQGPYGNNTYYNGSNYGSGLNYNYNVQYNYGSNQNYNNQYYPNNGQDSYYNQYQNQNQNVNTQCPTSILAQG